MMRTETYPGHVKPVRVGVYERDYRDSDSPYWCLSRWDGSKWLSAGWKRVVPASIYQSLPWRDLTKDHS